MDGCGGACRRRAGGRGERAIPRTTASDRKRRPIQAGPMMTAGEVVGATDTPVRPSGEGLLRLTELLPVLHELPAQLADAGRRQALLAVHSRCSVAEPDSL